MSLRIHLVLSNGASDFRVGEGFGVGAAEDSFFTFRGGRGRDELDSGTSVGRVGSFLRTARGFTFSGFISGLVIRKMAAIIAWAFGFQMSP